MSNLIPGALVSHVFLTIIISGCLCCTPGYTQTVDQDHLKKLKAASRIVDRHGKDFTGKSGYLYEKIRQQTIELVGSEKANTGGLLIETSIDSSLQDLVTTALIDQLRAIEKHPEFTGQTFAEYKEIKRQHSEVKKPKVFVAAPKYLQCAMVLIDNQTGATLAEVGGRDYQDSMFDRVSLARLRTGTLFQPFVYAAAFEKGISPETILSDLGERGAEDASHSYEKSLTVLEVLAKRKNAATSRRALREQEKADLHSIVALAERAGFTFSGDLKKYPITLLGRNPSTLEEIAKAYSTFPKQGTPLKSTHIISKIRDANGKVVYKNPAVKSTEKAVDQRTAFQINSMLEDCIKTGTAKKAREVYGLGNYPVAGKPGTTSGFTDNWFAGYTSEVTCVAWIGFDQRRKIYSNAFGSETVLPAWTKIMNAAANLTDPQPFLSK